MLEIKLQGQMLWDEEKEEFITPPDVVLQFEHSLVSLSKWEAHFERPFLDDTPKSTDETLWYIEAMLLTPDVENVTQRLEPKHMKAIKDYLSASMTATTFWEYRPKPGRPEVLTNEIIYYWMFTFGIPKECEHWHLNRLITLIKVFGVKNGQKEKIPAHEQARMNRELNEKRLREMRERSENGET